MLKLREGRRREVDERLAVRVAAHEDAGVGVLWGEGRVVCVVLNRVEGVAVDGGGDGDALVVWCRRRVVALL